MAKDPAMLWYWGDWHSGTTLLTRFQKGCYMDLLHAQFNNGRLSLEQIKSLLGADFGTAWPTLLVKFKQDETGLFFNERLEYEKIKRQKYTESRRQSRLQADTDRVYIYVIKDEETGLLKIGSSKNPERRLLQMIGQKNPGITVGENRWYKLLWISPATDRKIEMDIHFFYEKERVTGEWFSLPDTVVTEIEANFFDTKDRMINRTIHRTENENENSISISSLGELPIIPEDENVKFSIEHCALVALNDPRWVKATGATEQGLRVFNQHLEKLAEYSKNPNHYKRHYAMWVDKQKGQPKTELNGKAKKPNPR